MREKISITECPRDAMQGIKKFIPTTVKVNYIQQLLDVGFDVLDFGSFVSAKTIPQLADTKEVLKKLDLSKTKTKLLAIVANLRGVEEASEFEQISYLGFPFSVSETFQQRNTNSSREESLRTVEASQKICELKDKELIVYLSMGFGNPYGDEWSEEIVLSWAEKIISLGIKHISLADTVGVSTPENISKLFSTLVIAFPEINFGAHFHSRNETALEKIKVAYDNGCRSFDSAIGGIGGCPMAMDSLVGNLPTEILLSFLKRRKIDSNIELNKFEICKKFSTRVFED